MQFTNSSQAIYLQIADYICEKILLAEWNAEEKIPSVRDMAVQLEVNPNTVARTYDFLKQRDIIYDKRGIGYFIASQGVKNAIAYLRKEFTEKELPNIFRAMYLLGVEVEDLRSGFEKFKKQYTKN
jgi:DNA-binding transcriptional regulator YhcF (GntR family)